ncbi:MAG: hypothetical protein KGQ58_07270 [Proteobacteria bacterium]|nr:hypothetical protein [Pseudomonadota bacterium]
MHPFVYILLLVLFFYLGWRFLHDQKIAKTRRLLFFDDCLPLFEDYKITQTLSGYPELTGSYNKKTVRLELIVDTTAFRKLPSLWLVVSLNSPLQLKGTIDYLVRPDNTEFYSPAWLLPLSLPVPETWLQHAILRAEGVDSELWVDRVRQMIPLLFEDTHMKELTMGHNGVRLVCQAKEASRASYTTMRYVNFDQSRLDAGFVRNLIEWSVRIHSELEQAGVVHEDQYKYA